MIGDGEGGPPEGRPERNDDHRDQDEEDGFTKADEIEPRLDEQADPGGRQEALHGIEGLAVQRIERRPTRLLRGDEMTAGGGQRVGPPVPGGDEQQNGDEDRVRRKEERDLAVGKTEHPGDPRRQVVASAGGQNREHRAQREPGPRLRPGATAGPRLAIRPCLPRCLHHSIHSMLLQLREAAHRRIRKASDGLRIDGS